MKVSLERLKKRITNSGVPIVIQSCTSLKKAPTYDGKSYVKYHGNRDLNSINEFLNQQERGTSVLVFSHSYLDEDVYIDVETRDIRTVKVMSLSSKIA